MKSSDLQRLRHIRTYCEDVLETVDRFGDDYAIFDKDRDYYNSVSMSLMQIGEISIGLSEEFREESKEKMPWSAIKGMRNMFAHRYASANKELIWKTIKEDIPKLWDFCSVILNPGVMGQAEDLDEEQ